ncbi:unnamed protein product [Mytilus coruscus]|uniref:Uncharacterized protein n=1 Tax=Mytilus coruscus TaxID=42192 RepID=A0A6J8AKU8_MYTCO|nr:unnamed protein product [Mytilus coruscus]
MYRSIVSFYLVKYAVTLNCIPDSTNKASWSKEDFPNPQTDLGRCGRDCKASWICDPGHILSSQRADELDSFINEIANSGKSGKCQCSQCSGQDGFNISVALVPSINSAGLSDKETKAREFAEYLRKKSWNFQTCGNNIVILVSRDDRQVRVINVPNFVPISLTTLENGNCNHIETTEGVVGVIVGIGFGAFFVSMVIIGMCICRRGSGGCYAGSTGHGHYGNHHHHNGGGGGGNGGGFSGGGGGDGGGGGGGGF